MSGTAQVITHSGNIAVSRTAGEPPVEELLREMPVSAGRGS